MPRVDLSGRRFGRLLVLKPSLARYVDGSILWECRCDCGRVKSICTTHLTRKNSTTRSCGCLQRELISSRRLFSLEGRRIGRLTVARRVVCPTGSSKLSHKVWWSCKCDCGSTVIITADNLLRKSPIRSCGCYSREMSRARMLRMHAKYDWTGINNPAYKPDLLDSERTRDFYKTACRKFRQFVLRRDKFTCRLCGGVNHIRLEVHHLNAWAKFPKQRFHVRNGMTLCKACHSAVHRLLGRYPTALRLSIVIKNLQKLVFLMVISSRTATFIPKKDQDTI